MTSYSETLQTLFRKESSTYNVGLIHCAVDGKVHSGPCIESARQSKKRGIDAPSTSAPETRLPANDGMTIFRPVRDLDFEVEDGSPNLAGRFCARSNGEIRMSATGCGRRLGAKWHGHRRERYCQWAYEVTDHFDLSREIVAVTMNYVDRFMAKKGEDLLPPSDFASSSEGYCSGHEARVDKSALVVMASLCLAIKLYDRRDIIIPGSVSTMQTVVKLAQDVYTVDEVQRQEARILKALDWAIHPPTPQLFLHLMVKDGLQELRMLSLRNEILGDAHYMAEVSVLDTFFVGYRPSEVVSAVLKVAFDRVHEKGLSMEADATHSLYEKIHSLRTSRTKKCEDRFIQLHSLAHDGEGQKFQPLQDEGSRLNKRRRCGATSPVSVVMMGCESDAGQSDKREIEQQSSQGARNLGV